MLSLKRFLHLKARNPKFPHELCTVELRKKKSSVNDKFTDDLETWLGR